MALAWETSECSGSEEDRMKSLIELGHFTERYKKSHKNVKFKMFDQNAEFSKGIPRALKPYLIDVNIDRDSKNGNYVIYFCDINAKNGEPGGSMSCQYSLETREAKCLFLADSPDFQIQK